MSATAGDWKLDALGQWTDETSFEVERERVIAYAAATNDDHPLHRSGELAPPVFAIVPVFMAFMPSVASVIPGELVGRIVHGEQDFTFHKPIVPGQTLLSRTVAVGVQGRSSGVTVVGKAETRTAEGEPVVEQTMTAFVRGATLDGSHGEEAAPHALVDGVRDAEPLARVAQTFDEDQTFRYAEASGDPMPIHTDPDFAKAVGLPGIIIHGLCTMAFCSRAVIATACPDDPTRLRRLAVRFSKHVQPAETIATTLWQAGEGAVAFETVSDAGAVVIKDGLALVA